MESKYIVKNKNSSEYIGRSIFTGYFVTNDINKALKHKTYDEAEDSIFRQDKIRTTHLEVILVNFS